MPPRHYDQIVSLGRGCQPAHQIRRLYADAQAHVFDWIVTPDAGLLHSITTDLDGFFARERLEMGPEDCIVDRVTDARFLHELLRGSLQFLLGGGGLGLERDHVKPRPSLPYFTDYLRRRSQSEVKLAFPCRYLALCRCPRLEVGGRCG